MIVFDAIAILIAAFCLAVLVGYSFREQPPAEHLDAPKNPKADESWRRSDWTKRVEL